MQKYLLLKVMTPSGEVCTLECDSVTLTVCNGKNGNFGGSYGIKPYHANSIFALDSGNLCAKLNGETVLSAKASVGFAEIKDNVLTINLDYIELL